MSAFYEILIILINIVFVVKAARILSMTPSPSISHHYVYRGLVNGLAKNGHRFVVVTPDLQNPHLLHENIEEVDVRNFSYSCYKKIDFPLLLSERTNPIDLFKLILRERDGKHKGIKLGGQRVVDILENDDEQFDLVLHESMYNNLMYYTQRFEAPIVGLATALFPMENYRFLEMPYNPLFYTETFATYYDITDGKGDLSFSEKAFVLYTFIQQMQIYEAFLKKSAEFDKKMVDIELEDLIRKTSVHFLFLSPFDNGNRPVTEKLKLLGDMSTGRKLVYEDDLSDDLMAKMNNAKNGIIYFSLGTNVRSTALANIVMELFKSVFRELDQFLIFWKWDADSMEDTPENVIISKNFPQYTILKHPYTKLIITHGGRHSLDEALAAEIPVLLLPFWLDQPSNAHYARKAGLGLVLDIYSVKKEELKETILEVINNPIYKQNTIRHKELINDVPQTGLEMASYWVDYVLRHKNTKHFDPEPSDFTSFFWIDVVLFFFMIALCTTVLLYVSWKYVSVKSFGKKKQ